MCIYRSRFSHDAFHVNIYLRTTLPLNLVYIVDLSLIKIHQEIVCVCISWNLAILSPTYAHIRKKTSFFPAGKAYSWFLCKLCFCEMEPYHHQPLVPAFSFAVGLYCLNVCVCVLCVMYLCMPNTLFQVFTKENLMPRLSALCQRYHRSTPTFSYILNSLTRFFYNLIAVSAPLWHLLCVKCYCRIPHIKWSAFGLIILYEFEEFNRGYSVTERLFYKQ